MGASKRYFLTTREMEDQEFYEWYSNQKYMIENWKAEPTDKSLFEGDEVYNTLLKDKLKADKKLKDYKYDKRQNQ